MDTVMPTVVKTAFVAHSGSVCRYDSSSKQWLFQWMLSSDERLYVDKVCCCEIGSAFLSIFWCNDDGRPLSIIYPDISTCSTHKAILYPPKYAVHLFSGAVFSSINYLYQKMFATFCLFLFLLCLYTDF